jgi:phage regulator Rha-like protein
MSKEIININNTNEEIKTIDTREVAEMMGIEHKLILRKLDGTKDGKTKGIIPILRENNFVLSDYFIESTYKTEGNNKTYICYLCTKLGCEMLANKFSGEKGILFTASYVRRFNDMEKQIQKPILSFQIDDAIERAKVWIKEQEESRKLLAQKDEIIEELSPLASIARERMDKVGTITLTSVTKTYGLKQGQISCWAKVNGYIHKSIAEVNKEGEDYFKCIEDNLGHKSIAIKENGIKLIDKNIEDIKISPCRFPKKEKEKADN